MKASLSVLIRAGLILAVFLTAGIFLVARSQNDRTLTSDEAMAIAIESDEAREFLALDQGRLASCLDRRVLKPCDSGWVTCIDDAWVVEFSAGAACGIDHDGRLSLRLLIDRDGLVISRFPEKEYFSDPGYCLEDYDCLPVVDGNTEACRNFIYAQKDQGVSRGGGGCGCLGQKCSGKVFHGNARLE